MDPVEYLAERTDGTPVKGQWETIFEPGEWQELVNELDSRKNSGRGRKKGSTVTKRLMTGIARCAKCGTGLSSGMYARGTTSCEKHGYYYYTVDMKRKEIMKSIEAVVISGAGKGGAQNGVFRPELIEIVWK